MTTNNLKKTAIIIDPYSSGSEYAPAFREAGVEEIVAVLSSPTPPEYASSYRSENFNQTFTTNFLENNCVEPELIENLKKLNPLCILPGAEFGVELADLIAAQVNPHIANDPSKSSARRDKGAMAQALTEAGLQIIKQLCTDNIAEVEQWLEQENLTGKDLVIKPPKSAGTDGVIKIPKGHNWQQEFFKLLKTNNRLGIVNDKLIIQEYIPGTEYVVDTMSYDGKHSICNICKYYKIENGVNFGIYDRMEWCSPDIPCYEELVNYAKDVLSATGMRFGTSHIEIMWTEKGPKLIEIGARPHGGGNPKFTRVATGDSQIDRIVRYFTNPASPIPESFQLIKHVSVVFLICRNEREVTNAQILQGINKLQSYHSSVIYIKNGDLLKPTKDLFDTFKLGFVILAHKDPFQIEADYNEIRFLEQRL